jgi:hypothetical protein
MNLSPHVQYLGYLLRHKWFVFLACLEYGVPVWTAIIHDWQKFTPAEWGPYVQTFYGPYEYNERPETLVHAFNRAWLHHQHKGPHHWQYWILRRDDGGLFCIEMPDRYRREMLADWTGAGRAILGENSDTKKWYIDNQNIIQLHPLTREWIEDQLGV